MAKLRGKEKEEFLKRMERGRKKAAGKNPKRKTAAKKKAAPKKKRAKKAAAKKPAAKKNASGRKTKKLFGKAFGRETARETVKARRKAAKSKTKPNGKRRGRKRNSGLDDAVELYTEFHGRAPSNIDEYDVPMRFPENFAELGRLKELRVYLDSHNPQFAIDGFGDCKVVATADRANIYFIGGNQKLDLDALDIASDKDDVDLGPCVWIMYHTKKGFHDFDPIDYYHEFGEENGVQPRLVYNRLNHRLQLVSGDYHVRPEGIVN